MKRKLAGITPMMVAGLPPTVTDRFSTSAEPPKRRCQYPWLMTTTPSRPAAASSSANARPSTGATRSVGKRSQLTNIALARSGCRSASTVTGCAPPPIEASASKERLCSR